MKRLRPRMHRATRILLAAVGFGAAFLAFAPMSVGGATTYVRTSGTSMQPRFKTGDLAVVRAASDYHVGDIVAYRSPTLGRTVLHRIVGRDGHRYVFKGDNNRSVDDERLGRAHIRGRLWFRVARGGAVVAWAKQPVPAAALTGVAVVGVGSAFVGHGRRRRRSAPSRNRRRRLFAASTSDTVTGMRTVALGLGAVSLAIAGLAASRPTTRVVDDAIGYTQHGGFHYGARVEPGLVYRDGRVRTGDIVFRRLANDVTVDFEYRFSTSARHDVHGDVRLVAVVSTPGAWHHTVDLTPVRRFQGDRVALTAPLDLSRLDALIRRLESATGVAGGDHHVTIVAVSHVAGSVAGHAAQARFSPRIDFVIDSLALRPVASVTGDAATTAKPSATPFATSQAGSVAHRKRVPERLHVAGRGIDVAFARTWGLTVGIALVLVGGALAYAARRGRRGDEAAYINARYGRLLVDVGSVGGDEVRPVVDVGSVEPLVQLAQHHGLLVMHHSGEEHDTYFVDLSGVVYRCRTGARAAG